MIYTSTDSAAPAEDVAVEETEQVPAEVERVPSEETERVPAEEVEAGKRIECELHEI